MADIALHALPDPWRSICLVAAAFVLAWFVSRLSRRLAEWIVARNEARHFDGDAATSGVITGLKRRATIVSLVQSTLRYAAYGLALLFALTRSPASAAPVRWPGRRCSCCSSASRCSGS